MSERRVNFFNLFYNYDNALLFLMGSRHFTIILIVSVNMWKSEKMIHLLYRSSNEEKNMYSFSQDECNIRVTIDELNSTLKYESTCEKDFQELTKNTIVIFKKILDTDFEKFRNFNVVFIVKQQDKILQKIVRKLYLSQKTKTDSATLYSGLTLLQVIKQLKYITSTSHASFELKEDENHFSVSDQNNSIVVTFDEESNVLLCDVQNCLNEITLIAYSLKLFQKMLTLNDEFQKARVKFTLTNGRLQNRILRNLLDKMDITFSGNLFYYVLTKDGAMHFETLTLLYVVAKLQELKLKFVTKIEACKVVGQPCARQVEGNDIKHLRSFIRTNLTCSPNTASALHGNIVTGSCLDKSHTRPWTDKLNSLKKDRVRQNISNVIHTYKKVCNQDAILQQSNDCYMAAATNLIGRLVIQKTSTLKSYLKCYDDASQTEDFSCFGNDELCPLIPSKLLNIYRSAEGRWKHLILTDCLMSWYPANNLILSIDTSSAATNVAITQVETSTDTTLGKGGYSQLFMFAMLSTMGYTPLMISIKIAECDALSPASERENFALNGFDSKLKDFFISNTSKLQAQIYQLFRSRNRAYERDPVVQYSNSSWLKYCIVFCTMNKECILPLDARVLKKALTSIESNASYVVYGGNEDKPFFTKICGLVGAVIHIMSGNRDNHKYHAISVIRCEFGISTTNFKINVFFLNLDQFKKIDVNLNTVNTEKKLQKLFSEHAQLESANYEDWDFGGQISYDSFKEKLEKAKKNAKRKDGWILCNSWGEKCNRSLEEGIEKLTESGYNTIKSISGLIEFN